MGSPDWYISMVDIHLRKHLWVYCPVHVGVKGNDQADRLAGKATITIGLICISEDLKCWGAWDTTCGHKAKEITTSVAWKREAWEEEALNNLPRNDEHWNCFKGNVMVTSHRWCTGIFQLNRTEQFIFDCEEKQGYPISSRETWQKAKISNQQSEDIRKCKNIQSAARRHKKKQNCQSAAS